MESANRLESAAFTLLLGTLALTLLGMGGALPWSLAVCRTGVTLCLLACAGAAYLRGRSLFASKAHGALGIYLGLVGVSALASPYAYGSSQAALTLSSYAATVFVASYLLVGARRRIFILVIFALAALLCLYGLAQALGSGVTPRYLAARVSGPFYNSNHFSGFLVLILPLSLSFALYSSEARANVLAGLLAGLAGLNLLLSFSWGLVAALPPIAGLVLRSSRVGRSVFLALSLVALSVLAYVGLGGQPIYRLVQTSVSSRLALAQASLKLVQDAPLLGVGPGNYAYAVTRYRPATSGTRADLLLHQRLNYAHNDFLQVASETGLPSLIAFLGFWAIILLKASPLPRKEAWGFKAGLVALLLHGLSDGNLTVVPANALLAYSFAGALLASRNP